MVNGDFWFATKTGKTIWDHEDDDFPIIKPVVTWIYKWEKTFGLAWSPTIWKPSTIMKNHWAPKK